MDSKKHLKGLFAVPVCVAIAGVLLVASCHRAPKATKSTTAEWIPKVTISQRTVEPLLKAERPYEDFCLFAVSVLRMGTQWHMWYLSWDHNYKDDGDGYMCYARSKDGVHWERPDLGLVEYQGNRKNNIVFSAQTLGQGGFAGGTVFLDDKANADERFKMVYLKRREGGWWVFGATSPDGLHWKMGDTPLLAKNSDTQLACFRDGDLYRLYVRMWSGGLFKGCRMVGYTESRMFGEFPAPEVIMRPDDNDPEDLQFYSSGTSKLGRNLYVMFPAGYYTGKNVVRDHVAFSKDGKHFQRVGREPIIDLGKGFDSKCIFVAPGAIPAEEPGTFWVYYMGWNVKHNEVLPETTHYCGGIGRFLLKISR